MNFVSITIIWSIKENRTLPSGPGRNRSSDKIFSINSERHSDKNGGFPTNRSVFHRLGKLQNSCKVQWFIMSSFSWESIQRNKQPQSEYYLSSFLVNLNSKSWIKFFHRVQQKKSWTEEAPKVTMIALYESEIRQQEKAEISVSVLLCWSNRSVFCFRFKKAEV